MADWAKVQREAAERAEKLRAKAAVVADQSAPPPSRSISPYPPIAVPGFGSSSPTINSDSRRFDHATKGLAVHWKFLAIIGAILAAGFGGGVAWSTMAARYLTAESLKPMQDDIAAIRRNQEAMTTTLNGQAVSLGEVRGALRLLPAEPIAARAPGR